MPPLRFINHGFDNVIIGAGLISKCPTSSELNQAKVKDVEHLTD